MGRADLLKPIASFPETAAANRPELLIKKLRLCQVMFDWSEDAGKAVRAAEVEHRAKEVKRQQLLELVDYIGLFPSFCYSPHCAPCECLVPLGDVFLTGSPVLMSSPPQAKIKIFLRSLCWWRSLKWWQQIYSERCLRSSLSTVIRASYICSVRASYICSARASMRLCTPFLCDARHLFLPCLHLLHSAYFLGEDHPLKSERHLPRISPHAPFSIIISRPPSRGDRRGGPSVRAVMAPPADRLRVFPALHRLQ